MQIQRVQNNNQYFTAKIVDSPALRKFIAGLSTDEIDTFERCIKDIESVSDNKRFIYQPFIIGNSKIPKINQLDKEGNLINPPMFVVDCGKSPINVFKQMADWYKSCAGKI